LRVNNIEVIYDHVILVLKGVSLEVPAGGVVALLGANGAGKSTTLKAISNLLRTEQEVQGYIHFMTLGLLVYSLAFAWIYAQGISDTPWLGQGVRFGVAVWMMTSVPGFLTYYTVQPWPGMLVAKQIGLELVGVLILGVAVAFVHRK